VTSVRGHGGPGRRRSGGGRAVGRIGARRIPSRRRVALGQALEGLRVLQSGPCCILLEQQLAVGPSEKKPAMIEAPEVPGQVGQPRSPIASDAVDVDEAADFLLVDEDVGEVGVAEPVPEAMQSGHGIDDRAAQCKRNGPALPDQEIVERPATGSLEGIQGLPALSNDAEGSHPRYRNSPVTEPSREDMNLTAPIGDPRVDPTSQRGGTAMQDLEEAVRRRVVEDGGVRPRWVRVKASRRERMPRRRVPCRPTGPRAVGKDGQQPRDRRGESVVELDAGGTVGMTHHPSARCPADHGHPERAIVPGLGILVPPASVRHDMAARGCR